MARVYVQSTKDGPNLVFVDGKVVAALCRCGHSGSKPVCDGSHKRVGFSAAETVTTILE